MSTQDWGTFTGNKFIGNLLLPERYTEAILLGMLSKIFTDLKAEYEFELKSLKGTKQDLTQMSLSYNLGGLKTSYYQNLEGVTVNPSEPITPSKKVYFEIAYVDSTATVQNSGYAGTITVSRDVDGNVLVTSTNSDFNNYTYIDINNDMCNYALLSPTQIIIYPPADTDIAVTIWNT